VGARTPRACRVPHTAPCVPVRVVPCATQLVRTPRGRRGDLLTITDFSGMTGAREPAIEGLFPPPRVSAAAAAVASAAAEVGAGGGAGTAPPSIPRPRPHVFRGKPVIFVTARVHSAETAASYAVHGLVQVPDRERRCCAGLGLLCDARPLSRRTAPALCSCAACLRCDARVSWCAHNFVTHMPPPPTHTHTPVAPCAGIGAAARRVCVEDCAYAEPRRGRGGALQMRPVGREFEPHVRVMLGATDAPPPRGRCPLTRPRAPPRRYASPSLARQPSVWAVKAVLRSLCTLYAGASPDGPRGAGVWVYADLHG
jgi:hypothetical protein